ncbi:MAG: hypothetical protein A2836_02450 [Candidatus Taylorbacteria bacterium RIFCSPHIGHO2_01_FULL_45_63]|uniref:CDP-diacylglycerol--glycerol-3-phosphate 3-phosphatidyltransferase n=1 Tax=Candidatus Taylorbacteria bacterium RIFCSPHIGHO2_02_FULL_45_35 TaxID=1802311 RepID=A0A1G2MRQ1_9BACT|nr:MAG: hypothetical protein A2836_02450 [Candidatus Taylorbacteria bacterium RIFCSPHIGHO2_01_FULL_45_63]OHA26577.1 MAG: hypothetical protein A3D56_03045 [Candidatus Taylorbacteria bacterium RIFCSPHIGHO2_02_FULL_45_35]OHA33272.1 MAG: hypothetical protein A3A22_01670 [Candidatus Taylorbacteria bacterium RIFCSPLOWO2_01_FULL_45_34b]
MDITIFPVANKPTFIDRVMEVTVLRLFPRYITPNHVTIFRFVSIPFILYLFSKEEYRVGTLLFLISAFSDAVDGAMARTRKQVTSWGKMFDPLADKLLIGLTSVIVVGQYLSIRLALSIVFVELLLIIGAVWGRYRGGREIQAGRIGKIKMILQSVGIGVLLLGIIFHLPLLVQLSYYILVASIFCALLALIVYRSI